MRHVEGHRYEICQICGLEWNVPLDLEVSKIRGYICPHCIERIVKPQKEFYKEQKHGNKRK